MPRDYRAEYLRRRDPSFGWRGAAVPRSLTLAQRLDWHSIPEPMSGCILWCSAVDDDGYGMLTYSGRKNIKAHQAAWRLRNGDIPAGLVIRHKCDVRACVNPLHMELGTTQENTADRVTRGRNRKSRVSSTKEMIHAAS